MVFLFCETFNRQPVQRDIPVVEIIKKQQSLDSETPSVGDKVSALIQIFNGEEVDADFDTLEVKKNKVGVKTLKYKGQGIISGKHVKWQLKIKPTKKAYIYTFTMSNKIWKTGKLIWKDMLTLSTEDPTSLIQSIKKVEE